MATLQPNSSSEPGNDDPIQREPENSGAPEQAGPIPQEVPDYGAAPLNNEMFSNDIGPLVSTSGPINLEDLDIFARLKEQPQSLSLSPPNPAEELRRVLTRVGVDRRKVADLSETGPVHSNGNLTALLETVDPELIQPQRRIHFFDPKDDPSIERIPGRILPDPVPSLQGSGAIELKAKLPQGATTETLTGQVYIQLVHDVAEPPQAPVTEPKHVANLLVVKGKMTITDYEQGVATIAVQVDPKSLPVGTTMQSLEGSMPNNIVRVRTGEDNI